MQKNFFLEHPVFSIVVSIVIFVVGAIGLALLPVDQYPQIVPPVVKITASYPGADAMTVTQAVATPIEQELNGTPGMIYMSSSSSNSGGFSALVTFDIDTDPESSRGRHTEPHKEGRVETPRRGGPERHISIKGDRQQAHDHHHTLGRPQV